MNTSVKQLRSQSAVSLPLLTLAPVISLAVSMLLSEIYSCKLTALTPGKTNIVYRQKTKLSISCHLLRLFPGTFLSRTYYIPSDHLYIFTNLYTDHTPLPLPTFHSNLFATFSPLTSTLVFDLQLQSSRLFASPTSLGSTDFVQHHSLLSIGQAYPNHH